MELVIGMGRTGVKIVRTGEILIGSAVATTTRVSHNNSVLVEMGT